VGLAIFAACSAFITTYLAQHDPQLLADRVKAGPVSETRRTQQIVQSLAGLLFVGVFVVSGFDHRYQWSNIPVPSVLVADILVVVAFVLVLLVFRENTHTKGTISVSEGRR